MVLVRVLCLIALLALSFIIDPTPVNAQAAAPVATPGPAIEADVPSADQSGSTRSRAEALAGAASEQFGKVLDKQDPAHNVAQSASKIGGESEGPSSPASGGLSASPRTLLGDVLTWLGKASDDYQSVLLRLSRPLGPNPVVEAARKLERDRQTAAAMSRPTAAPALEGSSQTTGIGDWVNRTASEYQREVVSRLAGLPPAALSPSGAARTAGELKPAVPPAMPAGEAAAPSEAASGVARPTSAPPKIDADSNARAIAEIRRGELERKAADAAKLAAGKAAEAKRPDEESRAVDAAKVAEPAPSARQKTVDGKRPDEQRGASEAAKTAGVDHPGRKAGATSPDSEAHQSAKSGQVGEGRRTAETAATEHARLATETADRIGAQVRRSAEALATARANRADAARALAEARKELVSARTNRLAPQVVRAAHESARRADERSRELQRTAERALRVATANAAVDKLARAHAQRAADAARKVSVAETQLERATTPAERDKAQNLIAVERRKAAEASRRVLTLTTMPVEANAPPPRADPAAGQGGSGVALKTRSATIRSAAANVAAAARCRAAGVRARTPGWYTVRRGDSLWSIAVLHYREGSRWQALRRANSSLRSTRIIHPCQRLFIPR